MLRRIGYWLVWLDRRIGVFHCRYRGHVYNFSSTDIVGYGLTPFAAAVWCDRCREYVPDPRGGVGDY